MLFHSANGNERRETLITTLKFVLLLVALPGLFADASKVYQHIKTPSN
jgi:hypothetical protein